MPRIARQERTRNPAPERGNNRQFHLGELRAVLIGGPGDMDRAYDRCDDHVRTQEREEDRGALVFPFAPSWLVAHREDKAGCNSPCEQILMFRVSMGHASTLAYTAILT